MSKVYYYAHTGHNIGLDRFRRGAAILEALDEDVEVLMMASDFRIASIAKDFGIKRALGVDVVHNIHNSAERGSKIIFDSDQIDDALLDEMTKYFSIFIRVSDDKSIKRHPDEFLISPYAEGEKSYSDLAFREIYKESSDKNIEITLFFSDDDYYKLLHQNIEMFKGLDASLLLGFYNFVDYEDEIAPYFKEVFETEEYDEVIHNSKLFITTSYRSALEACECGAKVIFIEREDKDQDMNNILSKIGIDIIKNYDKEQLLSAIENISTKKYHKPTHNKEKLSLFLKNSLNL